MAIAVVEATSRLVTKGLGAQAPPYSKIKKCKNVKIDQLNLNHYDKERDIKVHRADDCKYRNGDSNGTGRHELHGRHVDSQGPALARPATHTAAGSIISPSGFISKPEGFLYVLLVNQVNHNLYHYVLLLRLALGNHQSKGYKGVVS